MHKNILVTGGAGFIGSNLVDELMKNPENNVVVVDDLSTGTEETIMHHFSNPKFKFLNSDIRDYPRMEAACMGIDCIYHLAVQCVRMSIFNPDLVHEVNTKGTLNMLKATLKNNVKKFVYVSSSEVYGSAETIPMSEDHSTNPTTVYGASKLAGEHYTKAFTNTYGLKTVIVRPFNSYGPREHFEGPYGEVIPKFAIRINNNKPPLIFGDGNQTRDFTYVSDTVAGIILAGNSDELNGKEVNIARGEEVSINNIATYILEAMNGDISPEYHPSRPADVVRHYADISKAREVLDFHPRIDIKTGIKLYLEWLKKQSVDFSKETEFNWIKK
ncbi:MAG: SDR family NAD(P)-dependent oxidoreductase [Nanoarchaeota archaeon]